MTCTNYAHSATELVQMYERATEERGYVPDSFCAIPDGVDRLGHKITRVEWSWKLPAMDAE